MRQQKEHAEQVELIRWRNRLVSQYPVLALLHATPNMGQRHPAVGAKMKSEGMAKGFPDLSLPAARFGFHGLFFEMKVKPNKLTPEQEWWLSALKAEGNKTAVCWDWLEAARLICSYLGIDPGKAGVK